MGNTHSSTSRVYRSRDPEEDNLNINQNTIKSDEKTIETIDPKKNNTDDIPNNQKPLQISQPIELKTKGLFVKSLGKFRRSIIYQSLKEDMEKNTTQNRSVLMNKSLNKSKPVVSEKCSETDTEVSILDEIQMQTFTFKSNNQLKEELQDR